MSEMIERVALAIWRKREEGFPERVKRCTPDNIDRATGAWQQALAEARAAIEAMREPSVAMVDAGVAFALCVTLSGDCRWSQYVADMLRSMVDAALSAPGREGT